jgi:hypothetical protein
MSRHNNFDSHLTRRSWMVLAAAAATGCGGGSGVSTANSPGTGGTGIYAQGSISGFGSVIINGIKFDDTAATVQLDGLAATSSQLRLGMVASIEGERNAADVTLGTASSIEVWSIAQGLISQVAAGATEFTVARMTVQTDSATVLEGISPAAPLSVGMRVIVWGLQAGADGSHWRATRVAAVPATGTTVVSTGLINVVSAQRYLNGLLLTGSTAGNLTAGALVRVQGTLSLDGLSIAVTSARLMSPGSATQPQGVVEIEGLVTTVLSGSRFMLGNIEVDASSASFSRPFAQITVGARIEVNGTWQGLVLKAANVEFEDALTLLEVEMEAPIEQYTSLANFMVRGQRCDATGATISHGTSSDLRVGVKIKLKGTMAGDVLRVTELELDN